MQTLNELKSYVLYDTETTGLDYQHDRIVEHGCIRVKDGEVIEELRILVNQPVQSHPEAVKVHGLTKELLEKEGIQPKDACEKVLAFMGNEWIGGLNNVAFDLPFLELECNRFGLKRPNADKWFDVGLWHKGIHIGQLWNGKENFYRYALRIKEIRAKGVKYNLDHLSKTYDVINLRDGGLHGAIRDLMMTKHVFEKMKVKYAAPEQVTA